MARPKIPYKRPLEVRFWEKVQKTDSCWNWIGGKRGGADAYGSIIIRMEGDKRIQEYAHRVSYRMAYGEFDKSLEICHRCDNPACVRPDHLFLGTHLENMRDMFAKNRRSTENFEKSFKLINPSGDIIISKNISRFCRENKLHTPSVRALLNGTLLTYKKWKKGE